MAHAMARAACLKKLASAAIQEPPSPTCTAHSTHGCMAGMPCHEPTIHARAAAPSVASSSEHTRVQCLDQYWECFQATSFCGVSRRKTGARKRRNNMTQVRIPHDRYECSTAPPERRQAGPRHFSVPKRTCMSSVLILYLDTMAARADSSAVFWPSAPCLSATSDWCLTLFSSLPNIR